MPKNISLRNLIKKFKKFGFDGPYSGGQHMFMIKGDLKVRVPNPHKSDISKSLVSEILRQSGISSKDWDNMK
ncbi:type II toxin-antitoxin system HicA family toxin [Patescibacteria group bacterium]|nr:type II toxin-antitoxin system HicA family toxin [Patescibacteria group bacterium]